MTQRKPKPNWTPAPALPARPVRNRAGMTVMAQAGRRACDHRCQFARGRICSCRRGGRKPGVGAI